MASTNVNRPMNKEQKEADVNRKLQFYGIFEAFSHGKVPSNDQIDVALNSFLASTALDKPSNKLSDEGKVLIEDVRQVVKEAKKLLLSKNSGNLIQDFVWQTTQFDPKSVSSVDAPISKDSAKRDGDEALQGLRTLGTLLITNGQFRKLLQDSTILFRDIAGDAATNAAQKVRPDDEKLAQIDQPAESNTWHEKPDLSKDTLKKQAKDVYGGNPKADAKEVASAGTNAGGLNDQTNQTNARAGKDGAVDAAANKVNQKIDPETKDKLKERKEAYRRKVQNYYKQKMPEDRRDQIVYRLKKMILECQQHSDYTQAIQTLLRLAENYGRHGKVVGADSAGSAKETRSAFSQAENDLRTLIERFANGTSTSSLWSAINQIYKDAERDEELRNWFRSLDRYIRRCLLEQGYVLDDSSTREWDNLYDQGRYLLREKYRGHTDRIIDEVKFLSDQFDKDTQNRAFGTAVQKLFLDLGNDSDGKAAFKPHLIKDLSNVILPAIMEKTAYIPIPRIEYSDPQFDAIIENLILESDNFMPNVVEVVSDNYFRWGRKKIANKNKNAIELKVSGVQFDLKDVSFHIKRKSGFPTITDTGVADIFLPGDGFSFKIKLSTADKKDRQNYFKVDKVDVDFKTLKFKVTKSSHKLLFTLFKPIALKAVRPALQKAVEKAIKDQFNKFDTMFYQVKQEADRAIAEAKANPENAPNLYERYFNAFQQRKAEGKEKAKDLAEDKKVNITFTSEKSIFPNIKLPGGTSSKATEYKELARKGDKWESPVFSIGSANKSTDIPTAPKIQEKGSTLNNPSTQTTTTQGTHGHGVTNGHGVSNGNAVALGANNGTFGANNGTFGANNAALNEKMPVSVPAGPVAASAY